MKQMRSFLYVGVLATAADFSLYSLLVYLNICSYGLATVAGYLTGFVISFFLTRSYVFSEVKIEKMHHELMAVGFITALGLGLNLAIVYILMQTAGNVYVARAVAIGLVFFFNYFARKRYVYA